MGDRWSELGRLYDDELGDIGEGTVTLIEALREYIRVMEAVADGSYGQAPDERTPAPAGHGIWRAVEKYKRLLTELEACEVRTIALGRRQPSRFLSLRQ